MEFVVGSCRLHVYQFPAEEHAEMRTLRDEIAYASDAAAQGAVRKFHGQRDGPRVLVDHEGPLVFFSVAPGLVGAQPAGRTDVARAHQKTVP